MGVVNLLDSNTARHKIFTKGKKLYIRIFHHSLDMTPANAGVSKNSQFSALFSFFAERLHYVVKLDKCQDMPFFKQQRSKKLKRRKVNHHNMYLQNMCMYGQTETGARKRSV